jgi:hypothetical protein
MATAEKAVIVGSSERQVESERSFTQRWRHKKLFDKGFVSVPARFLQLYAHLKPFPLSPGEALFVLHLMEFKWDANAPFPGYRTLAARMGVSDKMARRYAQSLETKKLLRRQKRVGQTNRFDLTPLFDALAKAVDQDEQKKPRGKSSKERSEAMTDWYAKLIEAYRVMSDEEKRELEEWEKKNVNGHSVATSDWPGWERYIGKKPK